MLDQSTSNILSTLLGGFLTISGGFIANVYFQSSSNKAEKRKEYIKTIEQLYEYTISLNALFANIRFCIKEEKEYTEDFLKFASTINKISMLIRFYIPSLHQDFEKIDTITYFISVQVNPTNWGEKDNKDELLTELQKLSSKLSRASKLFSDAISNKLEPQKRRMK